MSFFEYRNGEMHAEGVALAAIALFHATINLFWLRAALPSAVLGTLSSEYLQVAFALCFDQNHRVPFFIPRLLWRLYEYGLETSAFYVPFGLLASVFGSKLLPILLVIDAIGLVVFRGRGDAANLRIILPGAMLGIALGWLTFGQVDARWIRLLIGIEALLFAFDRFRAARSSASAVPSAPTLGPGIFWSALSGFTSFVSHAGGPPIMQYLMPQNMDKMRLVGTTVIFFSVVNFSKLGPYAQLGLLDLSYLGVSLLLAPAIPLGYFAGYRLLHAVDMRGFNLVTAWTLLAAGAACGLITVIGWRVFPVPVSLAPASLDRELRSGSEGRTGSSPGWR